jgi:hypothetical protein
MVTMAVVEFYGGEVAWLTLEGALWCQELGWLRHWMFVNVPVAPGVHCGGV